MKIEMYYVIVIFVIDPIHISCLDLIGTYVTKCFIFSLCLELLNKGIDELLL